jgi:hypothetical protein
VKRRAAPKRNATPTTLADKPALRSGVSKRFGGSQFDAWNDQIMHDTVSALWTKQSDNKALDRQFRAPVWDLRELLRRMS